MKIKRKSPPTGEATETGSGLVDDDVIKRNPRMTSSCESKRKRLKATKINVDGLRNGNVNAHVLKTAGSTLPKRKRPPLNCVMDTGSRDDGAGVISISTNGSDIGNTKTLCPDSATAAASPSSAAVDGITLNIRQPNSTTLYQVILFLTYLFTFSGTRVPVEILFPVSITDSQVSPRPMPTCSTTPIST